MSYQRMDHADWVNRQIPYGKKSAPKKRADNKKGWHAAPVVLTDFQAKVMDIIGMAFGGIHNTPVSWDAIEWKYGRGIAIPIRARGGLATFDGYTLTALVFLCHEARIRLDISPHGFGYFLLCFCPRVHEGGMSERHPNLDEAVAAFKAHLPADHRIIYRAE